MVCLGYPSRAVGIPREPVVYDGFSRFFAGELEGKPPLIESHHQIILKGFDEFDHVGSTPSSF